MPWPRMLRKYARLINRIGIRLAGHLAIADLEHVGRKSGTVYHTPVRAFRVGNTVVIALNFGRESDWYQNIATAGTCRMRLGKQSLTLGAPKLVPVKEGTAGMPWVFGFLLKNVVRTIDCVQLPILDMSPVAMTRRRRP